MERYAILIVKLKERVLDQKLCLPKGFRYEFRTALLICPTEQVNPEVVSSIVGKVDHKVMVNSHWVSEKPSSPLQVWGGAVAKFSCITHARIAAEALQRKPMLKVIFFKELIDVLMRAEQLYPKNARETTRIVIRAANCFEKCNVGYLTGLLNEFGKPKKVTVFTARTHGVISKVEYPSQFQAYTARTALNGMFLDGIGFLKVEVQISASGKNFDGFVKKCFKDICSQ